MTHALHKLDGNVPCGLQEQATCTDMKVGNTLVAIGLHNLTATPLTLREKFLSLWLNHSAQEIKAIDKEQGVQRLQLSTEEWQQNLLEKLHLLELKVCNPEMTHRTRCCSKNMDYFFSNATGWDAWMWLNMSLRPWMKCHSKNTSGVSCPHGGWGVDPPWGDVGFRCHTSSPWSNARVIVCIYALKMEVCGCPFICITLMIAQRRIPIHYMIARNHWE